MAYGMDGLRLDEDRALENPYALHFETKQEADVLQPFVQQRPLQYVSFPVESPLLRGSWRVLAEVMPNGGVDRTEGLPFIPPNLSPQEGLRSRTSSSKIDWTDVLGWSLGLASVGLGVYLVKQGYENDSSNMQGLGVGLATAGGTWGMAEILSRSFREGERPDHRGSLFVISLASGSAIGLATKLTSLPAKLPPPSAFKENVSLDGKHPVSGFGP